VLTVKLRELLRAPPRGELPAPDIRVISVGPAFQRRMVQASGGRGGGAAMFEAAAQNVGARRARGRWVLFSRGELLLSRAVFRTLAAEATLDPGRLYLLPRLPIAARLDALAPPDARAAAVEEIVRLAVIAEHGAEGAGGAGAKGAGGGEAGVCGASVGGRAEELGEGSAAHAGDFMLIERGALHLMGGLYQASAAPRT
jgi:hypothetical protein